MLYVRPLFGQGPNNFPDINWKIPRDMLSIFHEQMMSFQQQILYISRDSLLISHGQMVYFPWGLPGRNESIFI